MRELLLLGLIARDEVGKGSDVGKRLVELRAKRVQENLSRRKPVRPAAPAGGGGAGAAATIKDTGCAPGSTLVGIRSYNLNLRLRVTLGQPKGEGGHIKGAFEVLDAGDGRYANALTPFVGRQVPDAGELIEAVRGQEPTASHFLNAGSLRVEGQ